MLNNVATSAPRLYRVKKDRVLTGLCLGIAVHLGISVHWVRALFALMSIFGFIGLIVYILFSLVTPSVDTLEQAANASSGLENPQKYRRSIWDYVMIPVSLVVTRFVSFDNTTLSTRTLALIIFIVLILLGSYLVWQGTDRLGHSSSTQSPSTHPGWMIGIGLVLFVNGLGGASVYILSQFVLSDEGTPVTSLQQVLISAVLIVAIILLGLMIMFIPLWTKLWSMAQQQTQEKAADQERQKISSQIHDSVLQTLAVIQKQTEESQTAQLARAQERQLRQWLFEPDSSVTEDTLFGAFRVACGEVENLYAVRISPVIVGHDTRLTTYLQEMIMAAREAMANAAKHSGCSEISAYLEITDSQRVDIFIKDRGPGFDVDAVPEDRHGIRSSIVARMDSIDGKVLIHSTSSGTEVELSAHIGKN